MAAAPVLPRVSRALTILAAVIVVAFIALSMRLRTADSRLATVTEPERALALLVGRTMDVETALTAAPVWERRLYSLTVSDAGKELDQAIAWYEELADYSLAPSVDLRLSILRGEAGRRGPLARALDEWQARGEPLATWASVVGAAYLDEPEVDADAVGDAIAELGPGWFADVLALRLAARFDEAELGATARRSIAGRAGPLLWRLRALSLGDIVLLIAGAGAALAWRRRPPDARLVAAAPVPPPWRLGAGAATLVQGAAISVIGLLLLLTTNQWLADRPVVAQAIDAPVMYLPAVLLAWRLLLARTGSSFGEAFGLRPWSAGWRPALLMTAILVGVGVVLDAVLALGGSWLQLDSHWSEWFDPDLAWGPLPAVVMTLVVTVVLAPVFEEIIFRGVLYGSLRARLGVWPSIVVSAAVFALLHGYGATGFASVFLSGALWAWSYERTRSLLPSIAAHMVNNAAVGFTLLWLLR